MAGKVKNPANLQQKEDHSVFEIINAFAIDLISIPTEDHLAWYVAREVVGNMGFVDCVVLYLDEEKQVLRQISAMGADKSPVPGEIVNALEIPVGRGVTGYVAQSKEAVIIDDLTNDPRYVRDVSEARSEVCVPLIVDDAVVGVIDCENPEPGYFTQHHLDALGTVAALTEAKLKLLYQEKHLFQARFVSEREQDIRRLFNISWDWVWEMDADLRFSYVSVSSKRLSGINLENLIGKARRYLITPEQANQPHWKAHFADLEARREFRDFEYSLQIQDGTTRHFTISGMPVLKEDGSFTGYRGVGRDTTERKKLEEGLRQKTIVSEHAEKVALFGYWVWDEVNDVCLFCSEGLARLREITAEEYVAQTLVTHGALDKIHPDDRQRAEQEIYRNWSAGEQYSVEYRYLRPDGKYYWELETGVPYDVSETGEILTSIGVIRDITAQKESEDRFRESEERYRQIASISSDWVYEMDADLRFTYFSDGVQRIARLDPTQLIGKTRQELLSTSERDSPEWIGHLADLNARREFRDFQYKFVGPDGETRYLRTSGVPVFNHDGEFTGYRGTGTDVTQQISELVAVAENTARLRQSVSLAGIGHYVWDWAQGMITSCTEAFAAMHDLTINEFLARSLSLDESMAWVHPDDRTRYRELMLEAVDGSRGFDVEFRIISSNGHVRHIHEVAETKFSPAGEPLQTLGAVQDITQQKKREEALKDAQRLASVGSWRWSAAKGELISFSEEYARVLGVPAEQVLERVNSPGYTAIVGSDQKKYMDTVSHAVSSGIGYEVEYQLKQPGGGMRDILEIAEPVFDSGGKCIELSGTFQDISDRKKIEREVLGAREAAEAASRAKSEFLSSMSHELRTPLNAILGFSQMLKINPKEPLSDTQSVAVDHIEGGGELLLELVNQVLELAKIETGQIDLSIEPVKVDTVISDCVNISQALAGDRSITVGNNAAGLDLPMVKSDVVRLKQVLLNLLSNAVKYNHDDGSVWIDVDVGDKLRVSVRDSGPGMTDEQVLKVFEPFDRLGKEATTIQGTGIGLTISKQIMDALGGEIGVESTPGEGSIFWIDLPLHENAAVFDRVADTVDTNAHTDDYLCDPSRQYRALYVEDNITNIELMQLLVKGVRNLTLEIARTGEDGIEMALSNPPDIVLMDIGLPGMDGIEATGVLKGHPKTETIPVLAITAAAMVDDLDRAEDVDFYAYLTKPIKVVEVLATLEQALQ